MSDIPSPDTDLQDDISSPDTDLHDDTVRCLHCDKIIYHDVVDCQYYYGSVICPTCRKKPFAYSDSDYIKLQHVTNICKILIDLNLKKNNYHLCDCKDIIKKKDIDAHNKTCMCRKVQCPNCLMNIKFLDTERHNKFLCPNRYVSCTYCDMSIQHDKMNDHIKTHDISKCEDCNGLILTCNISDHKETCQMRQIICSKCQKSYRCCDASRHIDSCPETILSCNLCKKNHPRKDTHLHNLTNWCGGCRGYINNTHNMLGTIRACRSYCCHQDIIDHQKYCTGKTCPVDGCNKLVPADKYSKHIKIHGRNYCRYCKILYEESKKDHKITCVRQLNVCTHCKMPKKLGSTICNICGL